MIAAVILFLLCGSHARIALTASAKLLRVTVKNLFVSACKRKSDLVFLMKHRSKVADKEQCLLRLIRLSGKDNYIICRRSAVDPLKSFFFKVFLIHGRMCAVEFI